MLLKNLIKDIQIKNKKINVKGLAINSKKPVANGIITCLNMKQAKARMKKGAEAANAVISVINQ